MSSQVILQTVDSPANSNAVQGQNGAIFPGNDWEVWSTPEAAGFSSQVIPLMNETLAGINTTGITVVTGGKVLLSSPDGDEMHYVASVRKSILCMLFGPWVENGTINLDMTLGELGIQDRRCLPDGSVEVIELTEQEKTATIRDLLEARSGVSLEGSNGGDDGKNRSNRDVHPPGTHFLYSNWDFNLAGHIFEQLTGKDIFEALEEQLAIPLGFQDWDRSLQLKWGDEELSCFPAYHMCLSTRDMARIAYLMLRQGEWKGQQLIPKDWVEMTTSVVTPFEEMGGRIQEEGLFGFGKLWWIFKKDEDRPWLDGAYTARGYKGQFITVLPKLDTVIAHKTSFAKDSEEVRLAWKDYWSLKTKDWDYEHKQTSCLDLVRLVDCLGQCYQENP